MFIPIVKFVALAIAAGALLIGCAQLKEAGRTIGHTTRDVTRTIGHGAREVTREIGHGTRDVVRDIGDGTRESTHSTAEEGKKTVKPGSTTSEY